MVTTQIYTDMNFAPLKVGKGEHYDLAEFEPYGIVITTHTGFKKIIPWHRVHEVEINETPKR